MTRRFQFSLRTLFLLAFVLSSPFSWPVSHPVVLIVTMNLWFTGIFA